MLWRYVVLVRQGAIGPLLAVVGSLHYIACTQAFECYARTLNQRTEREQSARWFSGNGGRVSLWSVPSITLHAHKLSNAMPVRSTIGLSGNSLPVGSAVTVVVLFRT